MKVHVLQHVVFEGLGSIEEWLIGRQAEVSWTRFFADEPTPPELAIDLLIVLGGPMGVHDEERFPWLAGEKVFVRRCIERGIAVLGICLGAQIIAGVLGGRVYANPVREIGWFPVEFLAGAADCRYLSGFPEQAEVFHWHGDTFDLPPGAVHLARSAACRNQAFLVRERVIGLQFHLETTSASARQLIAMCGDEIVPGPFIQPASAMVSQDRRFTAINALMHRLLDNLFPPG
ncbi:MAG: type 1 glutamine amidotransferase [Desulfobulbaceae bacterium]|nr:MAG: type 1 glutamine amidotransferase [Desulfobulbaceae bacterium]